MLGGITLRGLEQENATLGHQSRRGETERSEGKGQGLEAVKVYRVQAFVTSNVRRRRSKGVKEMGGVLTMGEQENILNLAADVCDGGPFGRSGVA